jgi:hypothetical protein
LGTLKYKGNSTEILVCVCMCLYIYIYKNNFPSFHVIYDLEYVNLCPKYEVIIVGIKALALVQ